MDPTRLTEELTRALRALGVEVRVRQFRLPNRSLGGLCRVQGRFLLLLEQKASAIDRASTLAEAYADLGADTAALAPDARLLVEAIASRRSRMAVGAPLSAVPAQSARNAARPKPGLRRTRGRTR